MNEQTKKKAIFIGIVAFVFIGGIFAIQALNSDDETEQSEEFLTPESQRNAYNNKIEAYRTEKQTTNMGTFEENFNVETKQKNPEVPAEEKQEENNSGLFDAIDRQIANMGGKQTPPEREERNENTTPMKSPSNTRTTGGGGGSGTVRVSKSSTPQEVAEEEPKKSRRQLREERLQEEANNQFQEVDKIINQQQQAPPTRRNLGKKITFDDLPETEQRRILLQTGQRTYQESEEISAKIVSTGQVKPGQTVRLAFQEKAVLSFKVIPSGTLIWGTVSFDENRMKIRCTEIRLKNEIIKVNLDVYATDGMLGLPISGESYTRESENEGLDDAISKTGRIGRIVGGVAKSVRRGKDNSVDLGNSVSCFLVNSNKEY